MGSLSFMQWMASGMSVSLRERLPSKLGALCLAPCLAMYAINTWAGEANCCHTITAQGRELARQLDESGVDHLWLAGHHVDWRTGEPNSDAEDGGHGNATHCSAFAASFAQRLGIYLLRPPQHSQILLASAQVEWLDSSDAAQQGWLRLSDMRDAQHRANQGEFVVAAFPNPNPHKPGHIAIVHPAVLSDEQLLTDGPSITQAGQENALMTNVRQGFRHHRGAWPDGIRYYTHTGRLTRQD